MPICRNGGLLKLIDGANTCFLEYIFLSHFIMIARPLGSDVEKIEGITLTYVNRIDLSPYNIIFKIRRVPIFDSRHFSNEQLNYSLL